MTDKFEKRKNCLYCEKEMDAVYRNKKFCSDKCRVYFGRENKVVISNDVSVKDATKPTNEIKPPKQPKTNYSINTAKKEMPQGLDKFQKLRWLRENS